MTKELKEIKPAERRSAEIKPWRLADIETAFERMFDDSWLRPFPRFWRPRTFTLEAPSLDMFEEKDDLVIKAEIPGLTKDEIEVSMAGNMLTLKGEKKKEEETKEKDYYRCERSFGSFSRTIELPLAVKSEAVKAEFKNGVLEIRLPRAEEVKKNVVQVKVA